MIAVASKNHIRSVSKLARENFGTHERLNADNRILETFKGLVPGILDVFCNNSSQGLNISGYYPLNGEVNSLPLMKYARDISYYTTLSLPVVTSTKKSTMIFRKYSDDSDLKVGKYNVMEPNLNCLTINPNIMIAPLVSFDSEFNRVGFGKGFYDRYIAKSRQNVFPFITVGIAYNCQMWSETISSDKYDQKLDIIITENKAYFNEDSDIVQKIFSSASSTRILQEPILN